IWQDDGHFWFRDHDADGDHFRRVDAATGTISDAFDRELLAKALADATGKPADATKLAVTAFKVAEDGRFDVTVAKQRYLCDLQDKSVCVAVDADTRKPSAQDADADAKAPMVLSPDEKLGACIRDWNLWVRDIDTGAETRLTTDGRTDYGYATDNAGWTHSDRAILVWSPDSSKIATFQQDQREVGEMVLVGTNVGLPAVERWKNPLAGADKVTMIERVIIDVPARKVVRLDTPPDQH